MHLSTQEVERPDGSEMDRRIKVPVAHALLVQYTGVTVLYVSIEVLLQAKAQQCVFAFTDATILIHTVIISNRFESTMA